MCNCKDCKGITLLSGNDGKGIVSITYNEENNTIVILYTDGTSYTSPTIGCPCPENVFYSEEILGPESVGIIDAPIAIAGTTYTVPTGEDGMYRILYTAEAVAADLPFPPQADIYVGLTVNGTPHPIFRHSQITDTVAIDGIALNYQVNLSAGDVVTMQGSSTFPEIHYIQMAVMIIDKMP
jgi:hypothetical protein